MEATWRGKGQLIEVSGLAMRRLVATSILPSKIDTVVTVLDFLSTWAEETYEGRRVAAAIVIDGDRDGDGPDLKEIFSLPCSHILSDGVDSWLTVGKNGKLLVETRASLVPAEAGFYPYRYRLIAEETLHPNTVAAALNRNGEILVFSQGNMVFAKRRGSWRYFDHKEVISALSIGGRHSILHRNAVYESCLDASFARCGAGCAIIPARDVNSTRLKALVSKDDRVDVAAPTSTKANLLKRLIAGRSFEELPRHLRRELLGIDGSTVVSAAGPILAVGAILTVGAGSPGGGGRKAAAVAASDLGVAIKVSADGKISGFVDGDDDPVFDIG
jgi:hypothetical protein